MKGLEITQKVSFYNIACVVSRNETLLVIFTHCGNIQICSLSFKRRDDMHSQGMYNLHLHLVLKIQSRHLASQGTQGNSIKTN